ncbi:amidase [Rhodococcus sp. BP-241]|uniref:amidase n=1 Tax=Rhodococcus sp. BP-241 TaxID=2739441 RepID=UPI001C9B253F|nr:amidase [Rhodococcus sp. BP-241]MBY6708507.1 amidase [Rhodococcus sp. BP-241]
MTHAFTDDALGRDDAVGLALRVRRREVSAAELASAALSRIEKMAELDALVGPPLTTPVVGDQAGPFAGVPTLIKDNSDVRGLPTGQGSEIIRARPADRHGPVAREMLSLGFGVMAKTTLPEFGLSASTEFPTRPPTRNPWNTEYSTGASSGGSAALVAAGAVPLAHGNDGGGSIRIPAACTGLVGLKPSRGRFVLPALEKLLPVAIVSEGVLTRSVRDTAAFWAAADHASARRLRPIGTVTGPSARRLRVGVIRQSPAGGPTDVETLAALDDAAALLERLGHTVDEMTTVPIDPRFPEDFVEYWSFLAYVLQKTTPRLEGRTERDFDTLTVGLADRFRRTRYRLPSVVRRLRRAGADYASMFASVDLVLSPVLGHTTPRLGHLSPHVPFDEYLERLTSYAAFTPLHNVAGAPAMSLPLGRSSAGLPVGVMFSGVQGDERTLLEVAFEIEGAAPWRSLAD